MLSVDKRYAISATGQSKRARLPVDLACSQDDDVEQRADIDSEKELDDTELEDSSSAEGSYEGLECYHRLPPYKADVQQFVGEQAGWTELLLMILMKICNLVILFLAAFSNHIRGNCSRDQPIYATGCTSKE
jgi:hypothetical protein